MVDLYGLMKRATDALFTRRPISLNDLQTQFFLMNPKFNLQTSECVALIDGEINDYVGTVSIVYTFSPTSHISIILSGALCPTPSDWQEIDGLRPEILKSLHVDFGYYVIYSGVSTQFGATWNKRSNTIDTIFANGF